jgi:hypothetical protein
MKFRGIRLLNHLSQPHWRDRIKRDLDVALRLETVASDSLRMLSR